MKYIICHQFQSEVSHSMKIRQWFWDVLWVLRMRHKQIETKHVFLNTHMDMYMYMAGAVRDSVEQFSSVVQSSTVQYNAVQCSTVQYSVQCSAVQCSTVQYGAIQYNTVQYSTTQYVAMRCSAVQCSIVMCVCKYSAMQYSECASAYLGRAPGSGAFPVAYLT
jgi:hypothetical protein